MSKIALIKFHNAGRLIVERKLWKVTSIVATRLAIFVINVMRLSKKKFEIIKLYFSYIEPF